MLGIHFLLRVVRPQGGRKGHVWEVRGWRSVEVPAWSSPGFTRPKAFCRHCLLKSFQHPGKVGIVTSKTTCKFGAQVIKKVSVKPQAQLP